MANSEILSAGGVGASCAQKYQIKEISYQLAMSVIVANHYLHRRCPCSQAFGLFEGGSIIGVICYGTPSSSPLRSGVCGKEESFNVIELTRLWIQDGTLKNAESFLIGNTIPKVNKEIIVSYAEIQAGHVGTVYQATNWIYTGLSAKRTNWTIRGVDKHCQTIADKYTAKEIREKFGSDFSLVPRPRKHRYVYFNCGKKRKKVLFSKLRYAVEPYPKSRTSCAKNPAQNTMEICHTAPNTPKPTETSIAEEPQLRLW